MAETKYGFINKSGQFVIDPIFDNAYNFDGGIAAVKIGEKWGYIDKTGCVIVEPQYDDVSGRFSEGLAWVLKDWQYFYIDTSGREVLGPIKTADYYPIRLFHEGLASVGHGSMQGCINRSLQVVIKPTYDFKRIGPFKDGIAIVECMDGKFGLINKKGQFVIAPKYDRIIDKIDGIYRTMVNIGTKRRYGFVDAKCNVIVEPKFEFAGDFSEGLSEVKQGARYGYVDRSCNFVIQPNFDMARRFSDGLAPVCCGTKWGYVDKIGNFAIKPQFDYAESFVGGYAYVKNGDKYGVIDKSGLVLFEPQYVNYNFVIDYDFRNFACSGMAVVVDSNRKYGYIDMTRHTAIEPIYNSASEFQEGLASVEIESHIDAATVFKRLPRRLAQNNRSSTSQQTNQSRTNNSMHRAQQSSGCYIATAVYGSYDCPEVWTLRRYRDDVLDSTWYGRTFIRTYYAISPTLVKWFGKTNWFRNLFLKPLTRWVAILNKHGFENTPYNDKY